MLHPSGRRAAGLGGVRVRERVRSRARRFTVRCKLPGLISVPAHCSSRKIEVNVVCMQSVNADNAIDSREHLRGRRGDEKNRDIAIGFPEENSSTCSRHKEKETGNAED